MLPITSHVFFLYSYLVMVFVVFLLESLYLQSIHFKREKGNFFCKIWNLRVLWAKLFCEFFAKINNFMLNPGLVVKIFYERFEDFFYCSVLIHIVSR